MRKRLVIFCALILQISWASSSGWSDSYKEDHGENTSFVRQAASWIKEGIKIPIRGTWRLAQGVWENPVPYVVLYVSLFSSTQTLALSLKEGNEGSNFEELCPEYNCSVNNETASFQKGFFEKANQTAQWWMKHRDETCDSACFIIKHRENERSIEILEEEKKRVIQEVNSLYNTARTFLGSGSELVERVINATNQLQQFIRVMKPENSSVFPCRAIVGIPSFVPRNCTAVVIGSNG